MGAHAASQAWAGHHTRPFPRALTLISSFPPYPAEPQTSCFSCPSPRGAPQLLPSCTSRAVRADVFLYPPFQLSVWSLLLPPLWGFWQRLCPQGWKPRSHHRFPSFLTPHRKLPSVGQHLFYPFFSMAKEDSITPTVHLRASLVGVSPKGCSP